MQIKQTKNKKRRYKTMLNKKLESLKAYLLDMNYAEPDELNGLTVENRILQ